jgi:MFS family permease
LYSTQGNLLAMLRALRASTQHLPQTIWVLGWVSLLTDLGSEMVTSVMPLFLTQALNANSFDIGLIEGIAESTAAITKIFSGVFSDWLGQRKLLVLVGYGLAAGVKPLFAVATSSTLVLAARFVDRVGKGIRVAPRDALVADVVTPENRGAAYGFRQTLDTAGAFLGPIVAFAILAIAPGQFRLVFALACIPGAIAIAIILWGLRESPQPSDRPKAGLHWGQWRQLPASYWWLVAAATVFNLGNSSEAFLLLQAQRSGIWLPFIPLTIVMMNFGYLVSVYPVGLWSDRGGRRGLLLGGWLFYAAIYLSLALVQSAWQVWGLFACYGVYLGITQGTVKAMIADRLPSHLRGSGFGLFNLAIGAALLPASIAAGWLWQQFSPGATFGLGAGLALLAAGILWLKG